MSGPFMVKLVNLKLKLWYNMRVNFRKEDLKGMLRLMSLWSSSVKSEDTWDGMQWPAGKPLKALC